MQIEHRTLLQGPEKQVCNVLGLSMFGLQLNNSIKSGEETLKSLVAVRDRMRAAATEEKQTKGSVSKQTSSNLQRAEKQVEQHSENLDSKRKEVETIRARYEADLQRYRELKGIKTPVPPAPAAAK